MAASRGVFLSWAPFSRRSETLAERFGLDLRFISSPWPKRPLTAPLKFPLQLVRSVRMLWRLRPASVWVMDPPAPATFAAWLWCRRSRPMIVDVHTVAFYEPKWRLVQRLERPLLRAARAVVVTNDSLAARVRAWGGRPFVLPDPLPVPPAALDVEPRSDLVTVVATYSADEPIAALPAVAGLLPKVEIAVTGRPRVDTGAWPANLRPTGFLDDAGYWRQLASSAAVVVLTTRPDTLLSGGYEAMAVGRPLVVSDHAVLRDYYRDAAVYVAGDPESIAAGIGAALERGEGLAALICDLAKRRREQWRRAAARLLELTGGPA